MLFTRVVAAAMAAIISCTFGFPLLHSTSIQSDGSLRARALVTRQLSIVTVNNNDGEGGSSASASSGTGSSTSSVGLLGSSSSSESASQDSTSSSSSSCEFLGGCTSSAATACPLSVDNSTAVNSSTSSSLCGSGSSTDSGPALLGDSPLVSVGGLAKRAVSALAFSRQWR